MTPLINWMIKLSRIQSSPDGCECLAGGIPRGHVCGKPECWQVKKGDGDLTAMLKRVLR